MSPSDPEAPRGQPLPHAHVCVVTEATGELEDSLLQTANSLLSQSFQDWSWTVLVDGAVAARFEDPRIQTLQLSSRARMISDAVAKAQFVAFVEQGVELPELALEKWLWFLSSHREHLGVTGIGLEDRARLYRKEAIDAAGGCDAAWAAHPLGSVPWTGSAREVGPHERRTGESSRPRSWIDEAVPFRNVRPKRERRMMLISPFMSLGGADRFNIELLRGLSGRGWDLTVATTRAADHSLYPRYEEITADLFPAADVAGPFDIPLLLDYLMDSRRPDVVTVSQTELGYRLLPFLRSREFRPAFVDLCHSEDDGWYEGGFPRFSVEYGGLLDGTLVGSNHLRDWMVERGADAERIMVCHASVDHAMFAPDPDARASVRRKLGISTDRPVVLWIGRISPEKRPELLPRISAALTAGGLDHTLLVVGDGPDGRATEAAAAAEPESRLLFLGLVDDGALPGIYAASDVIVLPSRREGIALTLFEAMSSGVPVVAANIGGQAELVTPDVGFLIEPSDEEREVDAYATALSHVLRDPDRRAAMGSASRARIVAEFTEDASHDRIEHALEDALERHAHSPRPVPDAVLGRLIAAEAVELMRLQERGRTGPSRDPTRRERAFTLAQRIGGPLYRRGLSRGVPGLRLCSRHRPPGDRRAVMRNCDLVPSRLHRTTMVVALIHEHRPRPVGVREMPPLARSAIRACEAASRRR